LFWQQLASPIIAEIPLLALIPVVMLGLDLAMIHRFGVVYETLKKMNNACHSAIQNNFRAFTFAVT